MTDHTMSDGTDDEVTRLARDLAAALHRRTGLGKELEALPARDSRGELGELATQYAKALVHETQCVQRIDAYSKRTREDQR